MKKILIFLFMLLNLNLYSQSIVTVSHDARLTETLWDFEKHMKEVDFDKTNINCIIGIRVMSGYWLEQTYGKPCWGLTRELDNGQYIVYISEDLFYYKKSVLNSVVYHEMYHVFADEKEHCNGSKCPDVINGEKLNIKYLEEEWGYKLKIELLEYIKWNQDNN